MLKRCAPFLLALAGIACGTPTPPPPPGCTASTCAGCCDATGTCQDGTATTACGRLGLACAACQSGQSCVAGLCQGLVITGGGSAGGGAAGGTSGGGAAGGASGGTAGGQTAGGTGGGGTAGGVMGGGSAGGGATGGGSTGGGATGGGATGGGATGGGATGGGTAIVRSTRFQTSPIRFSVPGTVYNALSSGTTGTVAARQWDTLDLNGDGRVDLVLTSNPSTGAVFSTNNVSHWNVHLGTATGFSGTVTQWVVPSNLLVPQGYNTTTSATGSFYWVTRDLTGDRRPELVHTMSPSAGGPYVSLVSAATDGWLVRRGGLTSFDLTNLTFSVPRVPGLSGGLDRESNDTATRRWALAELTGDGITDLVITADPATDNVWLTNGPQWVLCPGSATGFPSFTACQRASVPDIGVTGGLKSVGSFQLMLRRVWLLLDLNGDGADDLVQPMNPTAASNTTFLNGTTPVWRVWFNDMPSGTAQLFSVSPTLWAVPATSYFTTSSATGLAFWDTFDLDGDRVPELVQTADPTTGRPFGFGTANPTWRVYGTARNGFTTMPTSWPIPVGPTPDGFRSRSGPTWAVLDVTGDGRVDLVQFQDPSTGLAFSDVSGAFWRVYPGLP